MRPSFLGSRSDGTSLQTQKPAELLPGESTRVRPVSMFMRFVFPAVFALASLFVALPAQAQEVNVNVEVQARVRVHTPATPSGHATPDRPPPPPQAPKFAITLHGGLLSISDLSPGFGLEVGGQVFVEQLRVSLLGAYHSDAGVATGSHSEVALSLELQRVFANTRDYRPYGLFGAGVAFASTEESNDFWDTDEEQQHRNETHVTARLGAGFEVGPADGFAVQVQGAAVVRVTPGRSLPDAIAVGGQLSLGLRLAL